MEVNKQLLDALKEIQQFNKERTWSPKIGELCTSAIAAAEQAQQAEPVAELRSMGGVLRGYTFANAALYPEGTKLYANQPSQPVPRDVLMMLAADVEKATRQNMLKAATSATQVGVDLASIVDRYAAQPPAVAVPDGYALAMGAIEILEWYANGGHVEILSGRLNWPAEREKLNAKGFRFEAEHNDGAEVFVEHGDRAATAVCKLRAMLAAAQKGGA